MEELASANAVAEQRTGGGHQQQQHGRGLSTCSTLPSFTRVTIAPAGVTGGRRGSVAAVGGAGDDVSDGAPAVSSASSSPSSSPAIGAVSSSSSSVSESMSATPAASVALSSLSVVCAESSVFSEALRLCEDAVHEEFLKSAAHLSVAARLLKRAHTLVEALKDEPNANAQERRTLTKLSKHIQKSQQRVEKELQQAQQRETQQQPQPPSSSGQPPSPHGPILAH
jgi:hypothetical protein